MYGRYIIQHTSGLPSSSYMLKGENSTQIVAQLKDGLKYIWADAIELEFSTDAPKKPQEAPAAKAKAPAQAKMPNVSQSLIKSLYDYSEGKLCGLQFKGQYIDRIYFPPTPVQKLGNYFEYLCTGALPRDGKVPEPERKKDKTEKIIVKGRKLKSGRRAKDKVIKKVVPGQLTSPYLRMQVQAERFKKAIKVHGIKIIKTGLELKYQDKKGIADILAHVDGEEAIIDIKSTGLIGDKWNEIGWDINALSEKDKIMIQPVFYKWLWRKLYGRDIPFYFMVFSNTNEYDCLFLKVVIDEERFGQIEKAFEKAGKMLNKSIEEGFRAYPDVKECAECPLKSNCKSFTDIPLLQTVHY